jgi:hypothetical protein
VIGFTGYPNLLNHVRYPTMRPFFIAVQHPAARA